MELYVYGIPEWMHVPLNWYISLYYSYIKILQKIIS